MYLSLIRPVNRTIQHIISYLNIVQCQYTLTSNVRKLSIIQKKDPMRIEINNSILFYPLIALGICIDFFSMFYFGIPYLYSLLALFAVALSYRISLFRLSCLLILLALESFLLHGQWGVQLIYLIPIALISRKTWDIFTQATIHAIIMLSGCLIAQIVIIDTLVGTNLISVFTLMKILINILLTICISLKYI